VKHFLEVGAPGDATTVAAILPKLNQEQRLWIDGLSPDERQWLEDLLHREGEGYFFEVFYSLARDLEYVRTL
jgi:hypothetical protein